jgi:hypothetical protein
VVVNVLGLGFEVTNSTLALAVVSASTKQKAVEMTTSHGFSIFSVIGTRRCVLPYRVRTKKSGLACCDGWLGVCTKGSSSHVQAVVAGYCPTPLWEVVPTIPGTDCYSFLLRQDQLA